MEKKFGKFESKISLAAFLGFSCAAQQTDQMFTNSRGHAEIIRFHANHPVNLELSLTNQARETMISHPR